MVGYLFSMRELCFQSLSNSTERKGEKYNYLKGEIYLYKATLYCHHFEHLALPLLLLIKTLNFIIKCKVNLKYMALALSKFSLKVKYSF